MMDLIHEYLRYSHVAGGFVGLFLFWLPISSKKGSPFHRQMGKYWVWLARFVLISAFLGILMYIPGLLGAGKTPFSHPNSYAFLIFLGYLSVVTSIITYHAVAVLNFKNDIAAYASSLHKSMAYVCIILSLLIIAYALIYKPQMKIVLFALSPVGLLTGYGMLKYMAEKYSSKKQWLYEHLSSMIAAGIAFHTAFAVFGMSRLFDLGTSGWLAVLPWVLPTLIGLPATEIWKRHYQKKFKEVG